MTTTRERPTADRESGLRLLYEATHTDLLRFVARRVHPSHAEDVAHRRPARRASAPHPPTPS